MKVPILLPNKFLITHPKDTPISEWITMGQFHVINGNAPPVNLDLEIKHYL